MIFEKSSYIGVDIGGTKIFVARFDENGTVEQKELFSTAAQLGREAVLENLFKAIESVFVPTVAAIGIAWPGLVKSQEGIVISAPNIPQMGQLPLATLLRERFQTEVFLENDARLFAYAETLFGKGKGFSPFLGIVIGTGVGSGLIIDEKIYTGFDGFAGEAGHMDYIRDGLLCTPNDCLSGTGLKKRFHELGHTDSLEAYLQKWESRQSSTEDIFQKWLDEIALWVANLFLVLNPAKVVFGGGVGKEVLSKMLPELRSKVSERLTAKGFPMTVLLESTELENAGALGAAAYAKKCLEKG